MIIECPKCKKVSRKPHCKSLNCPWFICTNYYCIGNIFVAVVYGKKSHYMKRGLE